MGKARENRLFLFCLFKLSVIFILLLLNLLVRGTNEVAALSIERPSKIISGDIGAHHQLKKNCKPCKNNGFRSPNNPQNCICLQSYFGDNCEKFCDHGQLLPGLNGKDYCNCTPFYKGEECRDKICLNGGYKENGRCKCSLQFLGYNCEIDTNHSSHLSDFKERISMHDFGLQSSSSTFNINSGNSRFQRFGDQASNEMFTSDISGTIFSLIMIIVLVVSMYLLMKHRMQARYLSRRPDLLGACNFPTVIMPPGSTGHTTARCGELNPTFNERRCLPFRCLSDIFETSNVPTDGPPPYLPPGHRGRRNREEVLPPLPTYEDATKLPPLRHNVGDGNDANENGLNDGNAIEMVSRSETVDNNSSNGLVPDNEAPSVTPEQRPALRRSQNSENTTVETVRLRDVKANVSNSAADTQERNLSDIQRSCCSLQGTGNPQNSTSDQQHSGLEEALLLSSSKNDMLNKVKKKKKTEKRESRGASNETDESNEDNENQSYTTV